MPYTAHIRDNSTGEVRTKKFVTPWEEHSGFLWGDGNYACDCNRTLFFARAAGGDDPDRECGLEAYAVRVTDDETGVELYADDDW